MYFHNGASALAVSINSGITPSYVLNGGAASTITIDNTNGSPNVVSSGTVAFQTNSAHTYSGSLLGNFTLTKAGSAALTLSNSPNRYGATNINAGQLNISNDLQLGTLPAVAQTGWININGGTLNATASITVNANRGIALGNSAGIGRGYVSAASTFTLTLPMIITDNGSGADSLISTGAGSVSLTGIANTFTGGVRVISGSLLFAALNSLGTMPGSERDYIFLENGSTLRLNNTTSATIPTNANIVIGNGNGIHSATISTNSTGSLVVNSFIKSMEASRDTLILARVASTGTIAISAAAKSSLNPSPLGGIKANSGAITLTETFQFDNLTGFRVVGATVTLATAFAPRNFILASGSLIGGQIITPVADCELRAGTFTNGIAGSANILKTTTGALIMNVTASNTGAFSGTLSVLGGTTPGLTFTSGNNFFNNTTGDLSVTGGTFTLANASGLETLEKITLIGGLITNLAGTYSGFQPTAVSDLQAGTFDSRFAGSVNINKTTAGTVILNYLEPCLSCTTQSDFTGRINVNAGILRISDEYALGARNATPLHQLHVAGGATIRFDASMYINKNRKISFGDAGSVGTANFLVQTAGQTVKIAGDVHDLAEGMLNPDILAVAGAGTISFTNLFDSTMVLNNNAGAIIIDSLDAQYVGSLTGTQDITINANYYLGLYQGINIANGSVINGGKIALLFGGSLTWPTGAVATTGTGGFAVRNNTTLNVTSANLTINGQIEVETGSTLNFNGRTLRSNGGLDITGNLIANSTSALQLTLPAGNTTLTNLTATPLATLSILTGSLGTLNINQALNVTTFSVVSGVVIAANAITATNLTSTGGIVILNGSGNSITGTTTISGGGLDVNSPSTFNILTLSGGTGVVVSLDAATTLTSLTFNDVSLNLSGSVSTNNLTLTAGSFNPNSLLTINSGGTITKVAGSLTSAPTFVGSQAVVLGNGTATAVSTGFELPTSITTMSVNTSANATLNASRSISGTFTFTNGKLIIAPGVTLTIPAANTISAVTAAKYFVLRKTSRLARTGVSTVARLFPVGNSTYYCPLNISNATSANFAIGGRDTVSHKDNNSPSTFVTTGAVGQTWYIDLTSGTANATVQFGWQTAQELASFNRAASISAFRFNGTTWGTGTVATLMGTPITNTSFSAQLAGITQFSPWSIGNTGGTLPVVLTKFDGAVTDGLAKLIWNTSSEINNAGFEVQASTDGSKFSKVGFVKGNGTTNNQNNYAFTYQMSANLTYFRLKQIDFDGKFEYSPTIALNTTQLRKMVVMPNPTIGAARMELVGYGSEIVNLEVINIIGQKVISITKPAAEVGENFEALTHQLPTGTYSIKLYCSEGLSQSLRFQKQ